MNNKILIGVLGAIIVALGGVLILARPNEELNTIPPQTVQPSAQPPAPPASPVSQPAVKEFMVTGKDYSFSPSVLTANVGDTIRIVFRNTGGFHDLKIDEFNVATKKLGTGGEDTVEFVANKAGSFEFYCSVGGHRQMGMKGTLTVR